MADWRTASDMHADDGRFQRRGVMAAAHSGQNCKTDEVSGIATLPHPESILIDAYRDLHGYIRQDFSWISPLAA